jgi:hypothetical protein
LILPITTEQDSYLAQPLENYLVFRDGVCDNADAAAVFDFELVRLSRSTAEAAEAALRDVCFECFAILYTSYLKQYWLRAPVPVTIISILITLSTTSYYML